MRHSHSGKKLAGSHKVKTHLLYGSKIPLLTIYAREINTFIHTHTHTSKSPSKQQSVSRSPNLGPLPSVI